MSNDVPKLLRFETLHLKHTIKVSFCSFAEGDNLLTFSTMDGAQLAQYQFSRAELARLVAFLTDVTPKPEGAVPNLRTGDVEVG